MGGVDRSRTVQYKQERSKLGSNDGRRVVVREEQVQPDKQIWDDDNKYKLAYNLKTISITMPFITFVPTCAILTILDLPFSIGI